MVSVLALLASVGPATFPQGVAEAAPQPQAGTGQPAVYLPVIIGPPKLSARLGYNALNPILRYPLISTLRAGWYLDWYVNPAPSQPYGVEYVPVVRMHQKLVNKAGCEPGGTNAHDRTLCPYLSPADYYVYPDKAQLAALVPKRPGSLWLLGNEIDRRDWPGGGQDEMTPELYARAYYELYHLIKQADPTARIANAGVIQPTPLRLEYMTKIWDEYYRRYGVNMPVDVWNVHNFILTEGEGGDGAGRPPGPYTAPAREFSRFDHWSHVNMDIFKQQLLAFRGWMKARGQQDKPLIVSEYGVLIPYSELNNATVVSNFMISTFDYFMTTRDCSQGSTTDDCRLVQRWAWYSLDDTYGGFNVYGALFNATSLQLTETGQKFRDFSITNVDALN